MPFQAHKNISLFHIKRPQFVVVKKKKPISSSDLQGFYGATLFLVGSITAGAVMGPGVMSLGGLIGAACTIFFLPQNKSIPHKFGNIITATAVLSVASLIGTIAHVEIQQRKDIPQQVRTALLDEIKKGKMEVFGSVTSEIPGLWTWGKRDVEKEISISVSPKTNIPLNEIGILEEISYISRLNGDKNTRHLEYRIPVDTKVREAILSRKAKDEKQVRVFKNE